MKLNKKYEYKFNFESLNLEKDFFGSAPSVFVGRYNYPNINVGILSPTKLDENASLLDAPRVWGEENYSIKNILDLRSQLVSSRFKSNIKKFDKFIDITKEVSQSTKAVDLEINLDKKPKPQLSLQQFSSPYGPKANLLKAKITSNTKIKRHVDKVVSDSDLKASDALNYLYKKGYSESFLTKLISLGNLGLKKNRKLVPSRWSITAVDDTLGKEFIKKIRYNNEVDNYKVYFGDYLGNYYLILLYPNVFSYELFEISVAKENFGAYGTDYESVFGRKQYAFNTVGGYYSVRLAILEKLNKIKKKASCLVFRFISEEYHTHLGVWVTREAARKSMNSKELSFNDEESMLKYCKDFIHKKFGYNLNLVIKKSELLKNMKVQKSLFDYN